MKRSEVAPPPILTFGTRSASGIPRRWKNPALSKGSVPKRPSISVSRRVSTPTGEGLLVAICRTFPAAGLADVRPTTSADVTVEITIALNIDPGNLAPSLVIPCRTFRSDIESSGLYERRLNPAGCRILLPFSSRCSPAALGSRSIFSSMASSSHSPRLFREVYGGHPRQIVHIFINSYGLCSPPCTVSHVLHVLPLCYAVDMIATSQRELKRWYTLAVGGKPP